MDNTKTGGFIRERRREMSLTQKQLADTLNITDRAVSKWERGLSAPDIALLEPLSATLGCTVTELIRGERQSEPESEEAARAVHGFLDYSKSEVREKLRRFRKRYLSITLYALLLLGVIAGLLLWHSGVLCIVSRSVSPDGSYTAVMYDRELFTLRPWKGDEAMVEIKSRDGEHHSYMSFSAADSYRLSWSPDSQKLVVEAGDYLELIRLDVGASRDLSVYLGAASAALDIPEDAEMKFLQWGEDSRNMLIRYQDEEESGCFWYNSRSDTFSGLVKFSGR